MDPSQTILIVDSDVAVRRSAQSILKATGYSVKAVTDFEQAQEALTGETFDMVVLARDLGKGPSGFVLIRLVRSTHEVPIVTILPSHDPDDIMAAFRLGSADVLLKPLRPSELLCVVDRVFGVAANEAAVRSGLNPTLQTGENPLMTADELKPVSPE